MTFQHRAGVSPYTSRCRFAWACVFGKQSPGPFLCGCGASPAAILIPKLRMHFAEFLDASSSVRLRILSSPTCVGLWYGPPQHILRGSFPARRLRALHPPVRGLPHGSAQDGHLTPPLSASPLCPGLPAPGRVSPYASPHRSCGRRGNVDPLPIAYGSRPRLRGRLTPGQIAFTLETSGFRRRGIPPLFAFRAPAPASSVHGMLPYPHASRQCRSFGAALSPAELSAPDYSTSELLRTL